MALMRLYGRSIIKNRIFGLTFLLSSCFHKNYQKLYVPDCCGGGDNLTPLGCLVFGPWQGAHDRYNLAIDSNGRRISSVAVFYSKQQQQLVFELLQDGSVSYWFKDDYDSSLSAKLAPDKNGISSESKYGPIKDQIKRIYKGGSWNANYTDSTVAIYFGKNDFNLPDLKGKYGELGSTYLIFKQFSFFDSTINGEVIKLEKITLTTFEHPYINDLHK